CARRRRVVIQPLTRSHAPAASAGRPASGRGVRLAAEGWWGLRRRRGAVARLRSPARHRRRPLRRASMRAVTVTEFGGPEVLQVREVETPKPGPGQILVDVEAIDVLDLDTKLRAGLGAQWGLQPPFTPGGGVAGTVS